MSRREFIKVGAAGLATLLILHSCKDDDPQNVAPNDRIVVGFIGLGRQGCNDFAALSACSGVQVAACCDVDSIKRERFRRYVTEWQKKQGLTEGCDTYENYKDLISRKDIDAVVITTPDHWHAIMATRACQEGKDVYCQKPLAFTITEGLAIQTAVRANNRIMQVGSQERSDEKFQTAIRLVLEGALGNIKEVHVRIGNPPTPFNLPEMPVPANLNFDRWVGPLNNLVIHYNSDLCPSISLDPTVNEKIWGAWR